MANDVALDADGLARPTVFPRRLGRPGVPVVPLAASPAPV